MMQLALPLLASIVSLFDSKRKVLAETAGVTEDVMAVVSRTMTDFLTKDEKVMELTMKHMQDARSHDIATFDKADVMSNRLRSVVRPVCTFIAIGWYVYARVNNIPLQQEDFAIVGGILAFWFGFRPFEKKSKGN